MKAPLWLSKDALLAMHDRLLADYGGGAGLRDEGLLESAMGRPRNLFAYEKQANLFTLAAAYAVGIIKNHPFVDGNKRAGFVAAAVFLECNGYELQASESEATLKTLGLAANELSDADYATWLKANSKRIKQQGK